MSDSILTFTAGADEAGKRLDLALALLLPQYSRSFLKGLITSDSVTLNGEICFRPQQRVQSGDTLSVNVGEAAARNTSEIVPRDIPLTVVYEDGEVLVLNKSAGMAVHPAAGHWDDTLANGIKHYLAAKGEDKFGLQRAGLVHRLDLTTSGVMIVAKSPAALWTLSRQFAERMVYKAYIAVVTGDFPVQLDIEAPIGRDLRNRQRFTTFNPIAWKLSQISARAARTRFQKLTSWEHEGRTYSLVLAQPETGRTHQIRVHLKHAGFPIVGDTLYGGELAPRILLHAWRLGIAITGSGQLTYFRADLPTDYWQVLTNLAGERAQLEAALAKADARIPHTETAR